MDRTTLASFVSSLAYVYMAMIFLWAIFSMLPMPYNRLIVAVREFLDQTVVPYIRLFRRILPDTGMIDLSPLVAIIALGFASWFLQRLILG